MESDVAAPNDEDGKGKEGGRTELSRTPGPASTCGTWVATADKRPKLYSPSRVQPRIVLCTRSAAPTAICRAHSLILQADFHKYLDLVLTLTRLDQSNLVPKQARIMASALLDPCPSCTTEVLCYNQFFCMRPHDYHEHRGTLTQSNAM